MGSALQYIQVETFNLKVEIWTVWCRYTHVEASELTRRQWKCGAVHLSRDFHTYHGDSESAMQYTQVKTFKHTADTMKVRCSTLKLRLVLNFTTKT